MVTDVGEVVRSVANRLVLCLGVEEVVDLTCEGSECAVVDLTNNDSVLVT